MTISIWKVNMFFSYEKYLVDRGFDPGTSDSYCTHFLRLQCTHACSSDRAAVSLGRIDMSTSKINQTEQNEGADQLSFNHFHSFCTIGLCLSLTFSLMH